jgi:hypothetical protein
MARTDSWSGLVDETRQALATLRSKDLEELARRAQAMFDEAHGQKGQPVRPQLSAEERAKLTGEHRLLGDLLQATENNLKVLRRLHGRARSGEVNTPWGH